MRNCLCTVSITFKVWESLIDDYHYYKAVFDKVAIIDIYRDTNKRLVVVTIMHPKFDEVPVGAEIPVIRPIIYTEHNLAFGIDEITNVEWGDYNL